MSAAPMPQGEFIDAWDDPALRDILRAGIEKAFADHAAALAASEARVASLTAQLAQCFKIAGEDCDGNEDWRIAPRAVQAVTDLRRDYDDACAAEGPAPFSVRYFKRRAEAAEQSLSAMQARVVEWLALLLMVGPRMARAAHEAQENNDPVGAREYRRLAKKIEVAIDAAIAAQRQEPTNGD